MYTPLELPLFSRIFHYVFMDIITAIIKLENESNRNSSDKLLSLTSPKGEDVEFYLSGYILFLLLKNILAY